MVTTLFQTSPVQTLSSVIAGGTRPVPTVPSSPLFGDPKTPSNWDRIYMGIFQLCQLHLVVSGVPFIGETRHSIEDHFVKCLSSVHQTWLDPILHFFTILSFHPTCHFPSSLSNCTICTLFSYALDTSNFGYSLHLTPNLETLLLANSYPTPFPQLFLLAFSPLLPSVWMRSWSDISPVYFPS